MKRTPLARSSIPLPTSVGLQRRGPMARRHPSGRAPRRPARNPMPPDVRTLVVDRDRGVCRRCGGRGGSIHHRIPRGMGGTRWEGIHSPALLVLLCGDGTTGCHGWVESNRARALLLGWLLSRHLFDVDPADVPLRWDDGRDRLFLGHDGTARTETDDEHPHAPAAAIAPIRWRPTLTDLPIEPSQENDAQ